MTTASFAKLPDPPYYAVIFSSQRTAGDHGYDLMADRMDQMASEQPGYLGVESMRDADGFGMTISYWSSLESITAWRNNAAHQIAQETGKAEWYEHYEVRIARVERAYAKRA
jgi:heme-degrading monooxygenase HmoA